MASHLPARTSAGTPAHSHVHMLGICCQLEMRSGRPSLPDNRGSERWRPTCVHWILAWRQQSDARWTERHGGDSWQITVHYWLHVLTMMAVMSARLLTLRAQVKIATFTSLEMHNEILEIFIRAN